MQLINGRGELLNFGGQVMKNVAGYDISRLQAGALGTLGLISRISLQVLPLPERSLTLAREVDAQGFLVNSFADTVSAKLPMYIVRGLGGVLYLAGAVIMAWNLWMTAIGVHEREPKAAAIPAE